MSDPVPVPVPLPIGDITFFDRFEPSLPGGIYWVRVSHAALADGQSVNTDPIPDAVQEIIVSAPQFALPADDLISVHPPAATSGRFGEELPHVVLREPSLPWERRMNKESRPVTPWLALLTLTEAEIIGPATSPTRATTQSIAAFLAPATGVYKPGAVAEDDVDTANPCQSIELSTETFQTVVPYLTELQFLAHCRQANIADKAAHGLDPDGFFSIVTANRFPAQPVDGVPVMKNIVHLVSLEGLEDLLVKTPDFKGCASVMLASLASWTFQCQADMTLDFAALVERFKADETNPDGSLDAKRLAMTMPMATPGGGDAGAAAEAVARLSRGYVPLAYHLRGNEESFAWYRGPLVPATPLAENAGPLLSADAAIAYQPAHGVFDVSLATAWEAGRAIALADPAFARRLLDFRRRGHRLTDQLLHRLQCDDLFTDQQIATLSTDCAVEDTLLAALDANLLAALGGRGDRRPTPATAPPRRGRLAATDPDPKSAVAAFLADPAMQAVIADLVRDDLDAIAGWLAKLLLLQGVPFNLLVPDAAMLPPESLRFFYLDHRWTAALLDGALSLGLESSRQTFFQLMTRDLLHQAAAHAARSLRAAAIGSDPPTAESDLGIVTGVLLRSSLVSGWPTLAVRPYLDADVLPPTVLRTLRMDHLSQTVLLCLFWGVPTTVEISEPQEGLQMGVSEGKVTLRNLVAPASETAPALGAQVGDPIPVYDPHGLALLCARAKGSRTLDMAALAATLQAGLTAHHAMPAGSIAPGQLALQMMRSPAAMRFASATS